MTMIRTLTLWLVLATGFMTPTPAQAGVICMFTGVSAAGTDCLGHQWAVDGVRGWSMPPLGLGNAGEKYLGTGPATDFHFECLAGCGRINAGAPGTQFLAVDALEFWDESVNAAGTAIDFTFHSASGILIHDSKFFVSVDVPIADVSQFRFKAWWTDDHRSVPEPASIMLVAWAILGLGLRRQAVRVT